MRFKTEMLVLLSFLAQSAISELEHAELEDCNIQETLTDTDLRKVLNLIDIWPDTNFSSITFLASSSECNGNQFDFSFLWNLESHLHKINTVYLR